MDQVEAVALWAGLLGSVISTVLAIVALAFTYAIDRRSSSINEQMIKSLQKIEAAVERTAGDTTDLINVAWDRMLPGEVQPNDGGANPDDDKGTDEESVRAISAGVVAELRAELAQDAGQPSPEVVERLDHAVQRLERSVRAQLSSGVSRPSSTGDRVERLYRTLSELSPSARELARQMLANQLHLTRGQYEGLRSGTPSMGRALLELRRSAILAPLEGKDASGDEIPVYYFSPSTYRYLQPALALIDRESPSVRARVRRALELVGYGEGIRDRDRPGQGGPQPGPES